MKKIFVSICILLTFWSYAQQTQHTVQPKETVYGISHQYDISQEALINANPFLRNRELQIGDVLIIPGQTSEYDLPEQNVQDHEDNDFYYIVIQPKQTLYSLSKDYNVSQETINSLNPFIEERGLQINDVVRIPKVNKASVEHDVVIPDGMHMVKGGETVYSIAQQYNLEMADIYAANRNLQTEGLKKGSFIYIPKNKTVSIPVGKQYFEHQVEKEETIFSILRKYDVGLEELINLNPELDNGLQAGMTLKVPLIKGANLEEAPTVVTLDNNNFTDNEINLIWMLPFFLDNETKHKGERQVAQDFYMGAQVALDQMIKAGRSINVEVIDVKGDKKSIDAAVEKAEFNKVDAIVGPFFQDMVMYVAQKLEHSQVPIFSPLINSKSLEGFENVYLSTPRAEYAADLIIGEVANAYNGTQEIKILTTSKEEGIAEYLKEGLLKRFGNATITITKNPNDLKLVEHKTITTDENGEEVENITYEPILTILASENNNLGSQYVKTITAQDPASIQGFSVYFVPSLDVFNVDNKGNIEKLKQMGFAYTAIRLVNTFGKNEKEIIAAFQDKFCTIPTKYMAIGYDIVYDVLDRMDKSGKISTFDAKRAETRLSSKIGYDQVEDGKAKINTELRIIRLNK